VALATIEQTGAVWGLAFDGRRSALLAAALHRRANPFGPGGPGAVYRIGLDSTQSDLFATVPNVRPSTHGAMDGPVPDEPGRNWAGKTSLGDAELSADGSELLVVNLDDRRIYRLDASDGDLLGSFEHGAATESWAADARPFGLGVLGERVFHGVVNSAESSQRREDLAAHVYSSRLDGSDMQEVVAFALTYERGLARVPGLATDDPIEEVAIDWQPWKDGYNTVRQLQRSVYPQPLVGDIVFDRSGDMLIGLRDRNADMTVAAQVVLEADIEKPALAVGDIVPARREGARWRALPPVDCSGLGARDRYCDRTSLADHSSLGGLAQLSGLDRLVATGLYRSSVGSRSGIGPAATWYENADGGPYTRQQIRCSLIRTDRDVPPLGARVPAASADDEWVNGMEVGDLEELCAPAAVPSPTASATASPSPTASATLTATPAATPAPGPVYLPALADERCTPERQRADVVLVLDASTSMRLHTSAGRPKIEAAKEAAREFIRLLDAQRDRAAIVWFNATASVEQPLTADREQLFAALDRIELAEYTRIHLGLAQAGEALRGPQRRDGSRGVVVLLTDGRSNPDPAAVAVAEAEQLDADGIAVFAIGLGDDLDLWALERIASRPADFRRAADAEELTAIYRAIARELPCPPETFWPWATAAPLPSSSAR
jgi:Mg-chelatase subunit ChlD